jgi:hypothetical protein
MFARDVKCPKCGADKDWPCKTAGGYRSATHKARWNACGIGRPTSDERHEEYVEGIKRDSELARRAFEAMCERAALTKSTV